MMYCKGCGYRLVGLDPGRVDEPARVRRRVACPECGREFEPEDPRTWDYFRPKQEGRIPGWLVMFLVMTGWVAFVLVMKWFL